MTYHNYLCVIGRMCGDDEDIPMFFENCTREDAAYMFRRELYIQNRFTDDEITVAEANGEGVFINHVLTSESPIADE